VSSYLVSANGALQVVSPAVPTTETAACWVVVTNDGRFAYTANAGSGSVSGLAIAFDGSLRLLDADGQTGVTGAGSGGVRQLVHGRAHDAPGPAGERPPLTPSRAAHAANVARLYPWQKPPNTYDATVRVIRRGRWSPNTSVGTPRGGG
jgi:hypothetical protein